jgi:hypothetical protein
MFGLVDLFYCSSNGIGIMFSLGTLATLLGKASKEVARLEYLFKLYKRRMCHLIFKFSNPLSLAKTRGKAIPQGT